MRIRDSRATKIRITASTKAQGLRVILASPSFQPKPGKHGKPGAPNR